MVRTIIGVDIGGTKVDVGVYDIATWKLLKSEHFETQQNPGNKRNIVGVLHSVVQKVQELKDETTIALGIGLPGFVDSRAGILYLTPNIPIEAPLDVKSFFSQELPGLPVYYDNDSALFALAEYELKWKGKVDSLVALSLGTGLGGGLILNGVPYRGKNGFAGEFGHMLLDFDFEYEDFVSGKANSQQVVHYLSLLLQNVAVLFNPEVIVLGGSVSAEYKNHETEILGFLKKALHPKVLEGLKIYVTDIDRPAMLGAGLYASFAVRQ